MGFAVTSPLSSEVISKKADQAAIIPNSPEKPQGALNYVGDRDWPVRDQGRSRGV